MARKPVSKAKMPCNKAKRTTGHPKKSHIVKACKNGKEKIITYDWYFPSDFNQETILAILLIVAGILVVYSLENFAPNKQ